MYSRHLFILCTWLLLFSSLTQGAHRPDSLAFAGMIERIQQVIEPDSALSEDERNQFVFELIENFLTPAEGWAQLSPHSEKLFEGDPIEFGVGSSLGRFGALDESLHEERLFYKFELIRGSLTVETSETSSFRKVGVFSDDWHMGSRFKYSQSGIENRLGIFYKGKLLLGKIGEVFFHDEDWNLTYEKVESDGIEKTGLFLGDHFVFGELRGEGYLGYGFFSADILIFGFDIDTNETLSEGVFAEDGNLVHGKILHHSGEHEIGLFHQGQLIDGKRIYPSGEFKVVSFSPYKNDFSVERITRLGPALGAIQDIYFPTHGDGPIEFFVGLDRPTIALAQAIEILIRQLPFEFSPVVGSENLALKEIAEIPTKDFQGMVVHRSKWLRDIGKFFYIKQPKGDGGSRWRLALFTMGIHEGKEEEKDLVQAVAAEKDAVWVDLKVDGSGGNRGGNLDFTASPVPVLYHGSGISSIFTNFFDSFERYKGKRIELDTRLLLVGHVDEILTTVPERGAQGAGSCGVTIIAGSPLLGLALFEKYLEEEYEEGGFFSTERHFLEEKKRKENQTLDWNRFVSDQKMMDTYIKGNANALSEKIIEVNQGCNKVNLVWLPQLVESHFERADKFIFKDANAVNMVVLGARVIIPKPKISTFENAIQRTLTELHLNPVFVDTSYFSAGYGEIHCGSNELRMLPRELRDAEAVVEELVDGQGHDGD